MIYGDSGIYGDYGRSQVQPQYVGGYKEKIVYVEKKNSKKINIINIKEETEIPLKKLKLEFMGDQENE